MRMITAEMIQCFAVQSCINIEVAPFTKNSVLVLPQDCKPLADPDIGVSEQFVGDYHLPRVQAAVLFIEQGSSRTRHPC
jgi:hypothetical protein